MSDDLNVIIAMKYDLTKKTNQTLLSMPKLLTFKSEMTRNVETTYFLSYFERKGENVQTWKRSIDSHLGAAYITNLGFGKSSRKRK